MPILTNQQKEILVEILSGSGPASARTNALKFRATKEEFRPQIDELESRGLLTCKENKYSLRLFALAEIEQQCPKAGRILFLCSHLFDQLRRLYKEEPAQQISLDRFAEVAELPLADVRKGLSYLIEAPIFASFGDLSSANAFVTPSESILNYKTFDDVLKALKKWATQKSSPAEAREKQQKFGILESPKSLVMDLSKPCGVLGRSVIYLDLDNFKSINTQLTETVVDQIILPPIHHLLASVVDQVGYAYAEGGDEFTILLPNTSEGMALAFAHEIRLRIKELRFDGVARDIKLSASFGVAHGRSEEDGKELKQRANVAKNHAKKNGRNCVAIWAHDQCIVAERGTCSPPLEELQVQTSTSKAPSVYLTAYETVHYLADESQWGVDKDSYISPEGLKKNVLLEAPAEFRARAAEGRITIYGASSHTGLHELIPKTHWMSYGLDLSTVYDSEAVGSTAPATFEAGYHGVRSGKHIYSDLKIEAADVYQVWPCRNEAEAEFEAAFELATLSRDDATKILWKLRKVGVAIRNEPVPSEQLFPSWKARYEKWRNDVLLVAEKVDENLRHRLEVLDRPRPPPTLPVINQDHALCITIASEILLRLEERLP